MAAANTVRAVTTAICTIWTMNGANQAGKFIRSRQIPVEQNRCAMACQGYGAVFLYTLIKSSGNQVLQVVLLSHHNQQSNRIDIPTAYDKNTIELPFWQAVLLC